VSVGFFINVGTTLHIALSAIHSNMSELSCYKHYDHLPNMLSVLHVLPKQRRPTEVDLVSGTKKLIFQSFIIKLKWSQPNIKVWIFLKHILDI